MNTLLFGKSLYITVEDCTSGLVILSPWKNLIFNWNLGIMEESHHKLSAMCPVSGVIHNGLSYHGGAVSSTTDSAASIL